MTGEDGNASRVLLLCFPPFLLFLEWGNANRIKDD